MMPQSEATIFALASGAGRAGVAVIRISGPQAGDALRLMTGKDLPQPRQAVLRALHHPHDGRLLDRALILWLPAPASFTGEDVGELHLHGGRAIIDGVCNALGEMQDLRLAEPGEFTRRGFENGKFDLTAAEAVADLIAAETEAQLQQALRQQSGALAAMLEEWRSRLLRITAYCEASIDFADEDLPPDVMSRQSQALTELLQEIELTLSDQRRGERLRDGFRIALLGQPNAGKSSLLNWFAARDAAIVSPIAGTTRDIVEVHLNLSGYPVTFLDTAGLRTTTDIIESEGIKRAAAAAETADCKILLFDASQPEPLDAATLAHAQGTYLAVLNKIDLLQHDHTARKIIECAPHLNLLPISLNRSTSLNEMLQQLTALVAQAMPLRDDLPPPLTRQRHRAALQEVRDEIGLCLTQLDQGDVALPAEHLRRATHALGKITGRVDVEDLLDVIFRDFCIGK
jgi:tRNA modification GTPase